MPTDRPTSNRPRFATAIGQLVDTHGAAASEAAVVARYMADTTVKVTRNIAVTDCLSVDHADALDDLAELWGDPFDLDATVSAFEMLVPTLDAQQSGSVFTPQVVSRFMATQLLDPSDELPEEILDPAVGCGALLVAVLLEMYAQTGQKPGELASKLIGLDINPDSLRRAHILLGVTCAALGDDLPAVHSKLILADSLTDDIGELIGKRHVAALVANPPYVRLTNIEADAREPVKQRWPTAAHGNSNLYYAFFEMIVDLLSPNGRGVLITPNNFATATSAKPLRGLLSDGQITDMYDFGHHLVFPGVLTYTAISVLRGRPGRQMKYYGLTHTDDLDNLDGFEPSVVDVSVLDGAPWNLTTVERGQALAAITGCDQRLKDVANIRTGIATLRNRLYMTPEGPDDAGRMYATFEGERYPIEYDITRPLVKVPDHPTQQSMDANTLRVIFPYMPNPDRSTSAKWRIMTEAELTTNYPLTWAYLNVIRDELAKRDKGKKTYAAWYAYGRTQGFDCHAEKLVTPVYAPGPRFFHVAEPDTLHTGGDALVPKDDSGLTVSALSGLLNSAWMAFYVSSTSTAIDGGYYRFMKTRIQDFGIPALSDEQTAVLESGDDAAINQMLADAYGCDLP